MLGRLQRAGGGRARKGAHGARPRRRPAGEPRRWVALAAGVAAVSLVGWLGFAPQQTAVVPVAQAPTKSSPQEARPAMVPLPSGTNDYLLAHQGFSPRVSPQEWRPTCARYPSGARRRR